MAAPKKQALNINLLPQEEFASSTTGRVLRWLLSTFRYLVIVTEMVVIGAFISRFYFDSRVADLNEEIDQKHNFILAYSDFEKEFRLTQQKLSIFSNLTGENSQVSRFVEDVASRLPSDVQLIKLEMLSNSRLNIQGSSLNEASIGQLVSNLSDSQFYQDVAILSVDSKSTSQFINFIIRADINEKGSL